jgi:hypothetical protein
MPPEGEADRDHSDWSVAELGGRLAPRLSDLERRAGGAPAGYPPEAGPGQGALREVFAAWGIPG